MLPNKLTLEGLYSYQERQTLDFNYLNHSGLFGIFGAVGSGKSTILEAITFALYGETERLHSRDSRGYNMMNLKSNRIYIDFEFYNYEQKLYRTVREFKRHGSKFEEVKPTTVIFYECIEGNWVPLEHTDATKIIGLNYANFKSTIIIPQGQFKEFLELMPADRTRMMKEIFHLHHYDLQENVIVIERKNSSELDMLIGKLDGLEAVSEEALKQLQQSVLESQSISNHAREQQEKTQERVNKLKQLEGDYVQLATKEKELNELKTQEDAMLQLQQSIETYDRLTQRFGSALQDYDRANTALQVVTINLRQVEKDKQQSADDFKTIEEELLTLAPEMDLWQQKQQELDDLTTISNILEKIKDVEVATASLAKGKIKVESAENNLNKLQTEIKEKDEALQQLKREGINTQSFMAAEAWYQQLKSLENITTQCHQQIAKHQTSIDEVLQELKNHQVNLDSFDEDGKLQLQDLEKQLQYVAEQQSQAEVQEKLKAYTHDLQDGCPCPLCGALEHPNILQSEDVTSSLKQLKQTIKDLEKAKDLLIKKQANVSAKKEKLSFYQQELQEEQQRLSQNHQAKEAHREAFSWNEFNADDYKDFEQKKIAAQQLDDLIKANIQEQEQRRKDKEAIQDTIEKYRLRIEELRLIENEGKTLLHSYLSNLKHLKFEAYKNNTKDEVLAMHNHQQLTLSKLETRFKELQLRREGAAKKLTTYNAHLTLLTQQKAEQEAAKNSLQASLEAGIVTEKLKSIEELKAQLTQPNIGEAARKKLKDYQIQIEATKTSIIMLQAKLQNTEFSEALLQQEEETLSVLRQQYYQLHEQYITQKAALEQMETEWELKQALTIKHDVLSRRAENIKLLKTLFKGAGFVQYVSSVYLRQLCEQANVRFQKMTRNRLSLQINDANNFEVLDYLNEGRHRSVKTLSGGQLFQASLSLALALAESVQTIAKSDRNFFFIDEGFGTQDPESVSVIFETLSNLNKENKIVGIITHLDELKEQISTAVTVVNDPERGSLISVA